MERTGSTLGAIREAIPRLEAEGLIITLRQRGLMIPSTDVAFVRNAYHLRRILEIEAIHEAITKLDHSMLNAWIKEHLRFLEILEASPTEEIADQVQTKDWQLHENLISLLKNDLITEVYRVNSIKVRMAKQSYLRVTTDNVVRVVHEHLAFLQALKEKNKKIAITAMEKHINNSLKLALGGSL